MCHTDLGLLGYGTGNKAGPVGAPASSSHIGSTGQISLGSPRDSWEKLSQEGQARNLPSQEIKHGSGCSPVMESPNFNATALRRRLQAVAGPLESRPGPPGSEKHRDLTPTPAAPRAWAEGQDKLGQVGEGSSQPHSGTPGPEAYTVHLWSGRRKKRPRFQHGDQWGALEGQQASE